MEENFRVDAHLEGGDGGLLPAGQLGGESYEVVLEDAEGRGDEGVSRLDAVAVGGGNGYAGVCVADVGYDGIQEDAWV